MKDKKITPETIESFRKFRPEDLKAAKKIQRDFLREIYTRGAAVGTVTTDPKYEDKIKAAYSKFLQEYRHFKVGFEEFREVYGLTNPLERTVKIIN